MVRLNRDVANWSKEISVPGTQFNNSRTFTDRWQIRTAMGTGIASSRFAAQTVLILFMWHPSIQDHVAIPGYGIGLSFGQTSSNPEKSEERKSKDMMDDLRSHRLSLFLEF